MRKAYLSASSVAGPAFQAKANSVSLGPVTIHISPGRRTTIKYRTGGA